MFAIRHFSLSMAGAACALALGIAVPAAAQPSAKETRQAHNVLVDYSICVADAEPDITRTFVLTDGADAARVDGVKRLFDSRCMGFNHGKLKMEDFLFRGALAQRLIEKTLASDALDNVADIEALNATYAGGGPAAQGHTLMYRIGGPMLRARERCLPPGWVATRRRPRFVRLLLSSAAACLRGRRYRSTGPGCGSALPQCITGLRLG